MTDACSDAVPPPLLVVLLRGLPDVADGALAQCERLSPRLADRPEPQRFRCLQAIRRILDVRLDLAADGERPATPAEESAMTAAISAAVGPDVDLHLQLRAVRIVVAHVVGRYWETFGAAHTSALLDFAAATDRFHHRLEQLIVDAHCRQFGPAGLQREQQRLRAEALLSGDRIGDGDESADGYLVLVVPAGAGLPDLPPDTSYTERDGIGIVVVAAARSTETLDVVARYAATTGLGAACAPAASADDIPQAHSTARELLGVRSLVADPPAVVSAGDALPETLLGADPLASDALAAMIGRLLPSSVLVETLTVFFDLDLDRTASAARLHIHRRTLTQRLDRIRTLTGHDPRSSRGVLVLGLALAAHRKVRPGRTPGPPR